MPPDAAVASPPAGTGLTRDPTGPTSPGALRPILVTLALYAALTLALLPIAATRGPEIPAITPVFAAVVLVTELATSFLLFVQFREARSWSLLLLACAYLYASLMAGLHLLTFPGAILPGQPVIGTPASTAWAFLLWLVGYGALTLAAIITEHLAPGRGATPATTARAATTAALAVLAFVLAATATITGGITHMPALMDGPAWTPLNATINYASLAMITAGLALILASVGKRNALFRWLGLALAAMLAANLLSLAGGARYTLGWSLGRLSWLIAAGILFLFFMRQFARHQRALARARQTLEQRVADRTAELTQTLRQRDLLLREVHHRVKNNLQVVDSLMDMEARRIADPEAREAFARLRHRVLTLGLVHQQLVRAEDLETFSIAPFLNDLLANLATSLAAAERGIAITTTAEPIPVTLDLAIPIGLIVNELVSNVFKHSGARNLAVDVRRTGPATIRLTVADDGASPAPIPTLAADRRRAGAGSRIIAGLTRQLGGQIETTHEQGTRVRITMPLPEPT